MTDFVGFDLESLFRLFPIDNVFSDQMYVPADRLPEPYRGLLAHEHHMTVTVEEFHGDLVDVEVLAEVLTGNVYARKIDLRLQKSRKCVLFGLVRIHLEYCSPEVRAEILEKKTPLGRILINHNVLRRIEPTAYVSVVAGPELQALFDMKAKERTYGRLALIHCDERPAIELLEIVSPCMAK